MEAEPRERNETLPVVLELLDPAMPEAHAALFSYMGSGFALRPLELGFCCKGFCCKN
jgi:hypothetical protein